MVKKGEEEYNRRGFIGAMARYAGKCTAVGIGLGSMAGAFARYGLGLSDNYIENGFLGEPKPMRVVREHYVQPVKKAEDARIEFFKKIGRELSRWGEKKEESKREEQERENKPKSRIREYLPFVGYGGAGGGVLGAGYGAYKAPFRALEKREIYRAQDNAREAKKKADGLERVVASLKEEIEKGSTTKMVLILIGTIGLLGSIILNTNSLTGFAISQLASIPSIARIILPIISLGLLIIGIKIR